MQKFKGKENHRSSLTTKETVTSKSRTSVAYDITFASNQNYLNQKLNNDQIINKLTPSKVLVPISLSSKNNEQKLNNPKLFLSQSNKKKSRKSLNTTVTLRKSINLANLTYIKKEKTRTVSRHRKLTSIKHLNDIMASIVESKKKLQIIYSNEKFRDDVNFLKVFERNVDHLQEHLKTKLRYNATCIIQRWYLGIKKIIDCKKELSDLKKKDKAAKVIQKNWHIFIFKKKLMKNLNKLIKDKKQENCAIIIQKNWKRYKAYKNYKSMLTLKKIKEIRLKLEIKNQAAVIIQKNIRRYLAKKTLLKLRNEHNYKIYCIKLIQKNVRLFLVRKKFTLLIYQLKLQFSALLIQKNWKMYIARKKYINLVKERNKAAIVIQKYWRMVKKRRIKQIKSAIIIQNNFRRYVSLKKYKLAEEFKKRNEAANLIKRNFSIYLMRKKLKQLHLIYEKQNNAAKIIQKFFLQNFKHKKLDQTQASIIIQKNWRSYITRKRLSIENAKASTIYERIQIVNKNAEKQQKIGEITYFALEKLRNYRYHGAALEQLKSLEKTTSVSDKCCLTLANEETMNILMLVVSECNRSAPCLQIIKLAFSIMLNLATFDKTTDIIVKTYKLKDLIIDTIIKHYKIKSIFLKCITLLYIVLKHENFPKTRSFTLKMQRFLKKISGNFQTKLPTKNRVYEFSPRWSTKKEAYSQFTNTRQALETFYEIYM